VVGYLAKQSELKEKGVSEVIVFCVNDAATMIGWGKEQQIEGSMIRFLADTRCEFTDACGMVMTHPGPNFALGGPRSKRFVIIAEDGVAKKVYLSEGPDDPAGDNDPQGPVTYQTRVENILKEL